MARKASPIGLRTWVWILAGLFVVCTLPLMAIALVQGTLRFTAAEDNLASLRQLRQTFDLANLVSAERGPANSLLGPTRPMRPSRHGWPRSWRPRASGSMLPCCSWTPCSRLIRELSTSMGCWPTRNVACNRRGLRSTGSWRNPMKHAAWRRWSVRSVACSPWSIACTC